MPMELIDVIYNLICDHTDNGNWSTKTIIYYIGKGNLFALEPYISPQYHPPLISGGRSRCLASQELRLKEEYRASLLWTPICTRILPCFVNESDRKNHRKNPDFWNCFLRGASSKSSSSIIRPWLTFLFCARNEGRDPVLRGFSAVRVVKNVWCLSFLLIKWNVRYWLNTSLFYFDMCFKQQRDASYDMRKTAEHFNSQTCSWFVNCSLNSQILRI